MWWHFWKRLAYHNSKWTMPTHANTYMDFWHRTNYWIRRNKNRHHHHQCHQETIHWVSHFFDFTRFAQNIRENHGISCALCLLMFTDNSNQSANVRTAPPPPPPTSTIPKLSAQLPTKRNAPPVRPPPLAESIVQVSNNIHNYFCFSMRCIQRFVIIDIAASTSSEYTSSTTAATTTIELTTNNCYTKSGISNLKHPK